MVERHDNHEHHHHHHHRTGFESIAPARNLILSLAASSSGLAATIPVRGVSMVACTIPYCLPRKKSGEIVSLPPPPRPPQPQPPRGLASSPAAESIPVHSCSSLPRTFPPFHPLLVAYTRPRTAAVSSNEDGKLPWKGKGNDVPQRRPPPGFASNPSSHPSPFLLRLVAD